MVLPIVGDQGSIIIMNEQIEHLASMSFSWTQIAGMLYRCFTNYTLSLACRVWIG